MLTILLIVAAIPLSIIIFSRNYSTKKQSVGDGGGGLVPFSDEETNIYLVSGCICDNFHFMYVGRLTRRKLATVRCAPKQIGLICICSLDTVRRF